MKKKLVSVVLAGAMAAALAACGSSSSGSTASTTAATEAAAQTDAAAETTEAAAQTTEAAAETTEASAETDSTDTAVDLSESKYVSDGVLTVGTNATFPPFEYIGDGTDTFDYISSNESGSTGFDIALMNEIGKRLGVSVEIEDMDFDGLVPAIGNRLDAAIAGMTVTEERLESVNFSDAYYNATQCVLLRSDSTIATEDDLKALTADDPIEVQAGTTGETVSRGINDAATVSVKSYVQVVTDLRNEKCAAVIMDEIPAEAYQKAYSDELTILPGSQFNFDEEEYAIAMPKDDEVMLNAINSTLEDMRADGTYDELVDQYINNYEAES